MTMVHTCQAFGLGRSIAFPITSPCSTQYNPFSQTTGNLGSNSHDNPGQAEHITSFGHVGQPRNGFYTDNCPILHMSFYQENRKPETGTPQQEVAA